MIDLSGMMGEEVTHAKGRHNGRVVGWATTDEELDPGGPGTHVFLIVAIRDTRHLEFWLVTDVELSR